MKTDKLLRFLGIVFIIGLVLRLATRWRINQLTRAGTYFNVALGAPFQIVNPTGQPFQSINGSAVLSKSATNSSNEIVVLQNYINAYLGKMILTVNGQFDNETEQVLKQITGKSSISLYEFKQQYMSIRDGVGENKANEIYNTLIVKN